MPALGSPALSSKPVEVPLLKLPAPQHDSTDHRALHAPSSLGGAVVNSVARNAYLPQKKHAASWPCLAVAGQAVIAADSPQGWAVTADSALRSERFARTVGPCHCSGEEAVVLKGSNPDEKNATSHHFWAAPSSPAPNVDVAVKTVRTCCKQQLSYGVKPPLWTQLLLRAELPTPQEVQSQHKWSGPLGHPLHGPPARAGNRSKSSSLLS
mmetsp:Transcript_2199/g.5602  ORF Transcript_2199/g.5602 Transcript_2199/m.5602 type:complete len:210 (-) Transcript_2199:114-743(-)